MKTGHRREEEEGFDSHFALGDEINEYMRHHACSRAAAIDHFKPKVRLGEASLRAHYVTAKVFPRAQRNRNVGFTKHQSLADVSRKNLPFGCDDEEYRLVLRAALAEVAREDIPVNALNGNGANSARNVMIRAYHRLCRHRRHRAEDRGESCEVRFPLVRGRKAITPEDVKRLEDEA